MSVQPGFAPSHSLPVSCFSVVAKADPGIMPRVIQVFAKRGLVPSQWYSIIHGSVKQDLHIDVQVPGLDPQLRELIAETLRQTINVETVLTSEKNRALSA